VCDALSQIDPQIVGNVGAKREFCGTRRAHCLEMRGIGGRKLVSAAQKKTLLARTGGLRADDKDVLEPGCSSSRILS
jgi:hypothetical protein